MLTVTPRSPTHAARFVLRAGVVGLGLFGLIRLRWTEVHLVLPFTRAQGRLAAGLFGRATWPIETTLACSGADALVLCLGAVLAYPVEWRTRVAGALAGAALILSLNTLRIGSLGRAASPLWFNTLHVYVWPLVLTLAIAGYVFAWMRVADHLHDRGLVARERSVATAWPIPHLSRRFVVLAAAFLVLFVAASPLYLESRLVLAVAGLVAQSGAGILTRVGLTVHASANVLWTPRGGFLVTQECLSTPLIPVYLAAICAYSTRWPRMILGALATLPLFIALGIVRLLVVAIPDVVASATFLVHAFYQLLLGAVVVFIAACWRDRNPASVRRALFGIVAGTLCAYLIGPWLLRLAVYPAGAPLGDAQGAIAFLPPFQAGLYLAVWIAAFTSAGWKRFLAGLAVLEVTQIAGVLALHSLTTYTGLTAHVRDVRAWAIVGPLRIALAVAHVGRTRH